MVLQCTRMVSSHPPTLAQIAVLPGDQENRQFRRRLVNFSAVLEEAGVSFEAVHIKDLSERGCRVSTECGLSKDAILILKLPGIEALRAKVVWCEGTEAGCAFDQELPQDTVDSLLGRSLDLDSRKVARSVFGLKEVHPAISSINDNAALRQQRVQQVQSALSQPSSLRETGGPEQVWIAASFGHGQPRDPTSSSAAYRNGLKRSPVDVVGISPAGAKICTLEPLETGATFWIKLPNLEPSEISVEWVKGVEAGCKFFQPLSPEAFRVVAHAVRQ